MCGLVRMHVYRAGQFKVIDVERWRAKFVRVELEKEGWVVTHTESL